MLLSQLKNATVPKYRFAIAFFALTVCLAISAETSTVSFENIGEYAGIKFKHERALFDKKVQTIMPWLTAGGAGVAVVDYDKDGLEDIYLTTSRAGRPNELYRNVGGFRFIPVGHEMGISDVNSDPRLGTSAFAMFFDFDGDHWQDLFLIRFGTTSLYRNEMGKGFKEVTDAAGLRLLVNSLSAIAFDYDNDNDLDIYIGGYFPEKDFNNLEDTLVLFDSWETARNGGKNYLFENQGNGTFRDVTDKSGLQDTGWAMAVVHTDINNDGLQDIYIANDFGTDSLFKNNGNGTFTNISQKSIGTDTKKGMNAEVGDYNNDGFMDIYVTNMTEPYLHECNMLWRNNGNETFTDVSKEANACDTDWGWGAKFFDANNDGSLDIYAANGFISAGKEDYMDVLMEFIFKEDIDLRDARQWPDMTGYSMAGYERNVLFIQSKNGFNNVAKEAKVDSIKDSRGVATADFDNDGRVDLVVSNVDSEPDVYRNVTPLIGNWIQVELEPGDARNANVIGSRIAINTGDLWQTRELASVSGFNAQSSVRAHFGLGAATKADILSVKWASGKTTVFKNLKSNHHYVINPSGKIRAVQSKKPASKNSR